MANKLITGLVGGEFTPHLDSRIDIAKYPLGCRHLENMITRKYGTVSRRPGTGFVVSMIDLDSILPSIIAHENIGITYENVVVTTLPDNATNNTLIPKFVCHESDFLCYENEPVVISDPAGFVLTIMCHENNVLFHENEIVTI